MSPESAKSEARGVRLEAAIRKALADAWARGEPPGEADKAALRHVRADFPDLPEHEIVLLIQRMRGGGR